jgi:hypothetical protein
LFNPLWERCSTPGHDFTFGCVVGSQLIGDHDTRRDALGSQQFAHQFQCGLFVPAALHKGFQNIALGIDGTPKANISHS